MRRRVCADGIAGRQARVSAHQTALPCRGGIVRLPDDHQQRGNAQCGAFHHREGGDAYANRGTPKNGGTRMLCIAGHVNKPGIYEVPLGMNMKKFIYDVAGGIPDGKKLKAVIPGGSSCPLMTADEIDIPMDYDSVAKAGSMLGSGGMVIMDEDTCMVDMARRIMHFY